MKRLLCLISSMDAGGAESFLMKMYRVLDRTQYQLDFCINVEGDCFYSSEIETLGGIIYHIPPKSVSVMRFKKQLSEIIRSNHYDYVMRITSNAMGFMDLQIAKAAGAKKCIARSSNSSDGNGWKTRVMHHLGRLLYSRYVDVKIAPSDLAASYTFGKKAYQNGEVIILPNAIDVDAYCYDASARDRIRSEFKIADDAMVIGHIGRFAEQKNHRFLLKVFREIAERQKNAVLLLIGRGVLEESIKERTRELGLAERVIFAGVRADVPQVLSAMDIFLFPSLYEGMPNTVIEAQANGMPCVISDTITREANISGLVKYLPLTDSAEDWAKVILNLAGAKRADTSIAFRERGYDVQSAVSKFVQIVFDGL